MNKIALAVFILVATVASLAQTFTTLVNFDGRNGAEPWYMSLAQGRDGNLYGTTELGGGSGCGQYGCGTAFRVTPAGVLTTLHLSSSSGSNPVSGLTLAASGEFYGTSDLGGANNDGAVFEVGESGEITLYSFCARSNCADGEYPAGRLIQASDGNFYGTTDDGGANFCSSHNTGCGTVFRLTPDGMLTTLYSFCSETDCADGSGPIGGLVQGSDGNFYGTTYGEGTIGNLGTVFRITQKGLLTTLHQFSGPDGYDAAGWLIEGLDGNFYGTTASGGSHGGGTVFKITPGGALTTLYSFCSQANCSDGVGPYAGLEMGSDGNFYGTTYEGGLEAGGTVFEITSQGTLTTLYSFGSDGYAPIGGLVQATNGSFYGSTSSGGDFSCDGRYDCGTVFSLSTALGPFTSFVNPFGRVGGAVQILGQAFTGTTSVSLNGTAASFRVVSDTFIEATVPAGATTGYVTVTTPGGTLSSNVPFRVLP